MDWLNKAEVKFGRFAVPGLVRIIAGFQLLVFLLLLFNRELYTLLILIPDRILEGQVWRLVTFAFIPRSTSPFWILFSVIFLFMINDGLEEAWGSFKLNLYVIASMISVTLGYFLLWRLLIPAGHEIPDSMHIPIFTIYVGQLLYGNLFFAFSVLYPNRVIQFMLVLPVKIKYIAMFLAAYLLLDTLSNPEFGILFGFALLPFSIFALPIAIEKLRFRMRVAERRQEYKQNSLPIDDAFHRCTSCGKTEQDDPHLEFRVAGDDSEYCVPCLDARKAEHEEKDEERLV